MPNSKDDALTSEELEKLWEIARENEEDRVIFVMAAELGMRASEISHSKKGWIDFQRQEITIPSQDGEWTPKTKNSARTIPYGAFKHRVSREIQNFFDYHDEINLARNSIWYRVKRMADNSGITKRVYPHSLRASAALRLANAGMNAQGLRSFFGWEKLETAEKYIRASGVGVRQQLDAVRQNLYSGVG